MAVITPNTNIRLIKLPIELSNTNQLTFTSEPNQEYYFKHIENYIEIEGAAYQRKDGTLRFPANYDEVLQYNYVMYQNESYSNKWFYAFVEDIQWLSNESVAITIKTDVFQTWQFDIEYKQSFIEREHVTDDTTGLHTVPENLELGEYVCNNILTVFDGDTNTTACIMVSDMPDDLYDQLPVKLPTYNSIFSGCYLFVANPETVALSISNFLRAMDKADKGDAVVSIFLVPNSLIPEGITYKNYTFEGITTNMGLVPSSTGAKLMGTSSQFSVPNTLNGYTPKNNKLKTYPYSYFYVTNNVGGDVEFHYEDFRNNTAQFKTVGALTPGCSIRCVPLGYKKLADDETSLNSFNAGLSIGKYPTCAWKTDLYTNWLTEQGANLSLSMGGSVISTGVGIGLVATGVGTVAGAGMIAGGLAGIANTVAQVYQHSLTPDQAKGNSNTGDVAFSSGKIDATAYRMSIKEEYARIIDNYFSMFGYKVNITKVPNINSRSNWNYVKTIECNLHGYIPNEDLNELKTMFDNGLTLWHHATTFLDYTQSNTNV